MESRVTSLFVNVASETAPSQPWFGQWARELSWKLTLLCSDTMSAIQAHPTVPPLPRLATWSRFWSASRASRCLSLLVACCLIEPCTHQKQHPDGPYSDLLHAAVAARVLSCCCELHEDGASAVADGRRGRLRRCAHSLQDMSTKWCCSASRRHAVQVQGRTA